MTWLRLTPWALIVVLLACDAQCRNTEPVWLEHAYLWPSESRPLIVTDDGTFAGALGAAVEWWNKEIGCATLVYRQNEQNAEVVVSSGRPPVDNDHCPEYGACTYMGYAPAATAYIWYVSPSTLDRDFRVLTHEIGHALGLDDDRGYRLSVMGSGDGDVVLVTEKDRDALRGRYCR